MGVMARVRAVAVMAVMGVVVVVVAAVAVAVVVWRGAWSCVGGGSGDGERGISSGWS